MEDEQRRALVAAAVGAREKAYAKYSDFPVGAALLCRDGSIVTGCNVENAVYPLGLCAERTAVVKAVSEGHREFTAVAVVTKSPSCASPCGSCRQVLSEFSSDGSLEVVMARSDGQHYKVMTLSQLLPCSFSNEELEKAKT
ncbi:Cytidine deaminase [Geodia barretti]|uniref:Cytidine deaminase n=1 Tax=Geodia barretti TaxID=519541 RepID=A0AA35S8F2_GEOBA|nr:Cytidine deaminase [Geodia barretti]